MIKIDYKCEPYDPSKPEFEPFIEGIYEVVIDEVVKMKSKAQDDMLRFHLKVLKGKYKNRVMWHHNNFWHPNDKTRAIAKKEIDKIGYATGVVDVDNNYDLMKKAFKVKVEINEKGYPNVKKWLRLDDELNETPQTIMKEYNNPPADKDEDMPF